MIKFQQIRKDQVLNSVLDIYIDLIMNANFYVLWGRGAFTVATKRLNASRGLRSVRA